MTQTEYNRAKEKVRERTWQDFWQKIRHKLPCNTTSEMCVNIQNSFFSAIESYELEILEVERKGESKDCEDELYKMYSRTTDCHAYDMGGRLYGTIIFKVTYSGYRNITEILKADIKEFEDDPGDE